MRIALALIVFGLGTAAADTKKDEPKPDPPAPQKCTVTKIAGKEQKLDVVVTTKAAPELKCKTESKKTAEKWVADNAACDLDKKPPEKTFKYTVTYGDKSMDLAGNCPKPEPAKKSTK